MKCPALLTRWAYRAAAPAAAIASPLLRERMHPGKRAYRGVRELQSATRDAILAAASAEPFTPRKDFARAVLESHWRTRLLQRYVARLDSTALDDFLELHIDYDGAAAAPRVLNEPRPLIFATPHYGAPTVAFVAGARLMRGRRVLNLFYDQERHGTRLAEILERAGLAAGTLLNGFAGVRGALRALERGECLSILPDAFDDIAQTLVVPFFGRLLRVASGTAFLALRSRALIVPVFAAPRADFGLRVTLGAPIDPCRLTADDERQAIFTLTHLLFSRIEAQLRLAPEHWRYWELLPQVSTALAAPAELSDSQLVFALKAKFRSLPPAVQDIPELELLLQ